MTRTALAVVVVAVAGFGLLATDILAQTNRPRRTRKRDRVHVPQKQPVRPRRPQRPRVPIRPQGQQTQQAEVPTNPDLVVSNIELDANCRVVVTVLNTGVGLPDAGFPANGIGIQFYRNNQSWGGYRLTAADVGAGLRETGASFSFTRPASKLDGSWTIGAKIDSEGTVAEEDDANNRLDVPLTCTPTLPDLAITAVTYDDTCHPVVTLENVGDDALNPPLFMGKHGGYLQRWVDGEPYGQVYLGTADPARTVLPPGGTVTYRDPAVDCGVTAVRYRATRLGQEHQSANNDRQAQIPARCQVPRPAQLPDIAVTDIRTDSTCHVQMRIENLGPGPFRLPAYDELLGAGLQLRAGNTPHGGWRLAAVDPQRTLARPGSAMWFTHPSWVAVGTTTITGSVDMNNATGEADASNNTLTKTVTCSLVNQ